MLHGMTAVLVLCALDAELGSLRSAVCDRRHVQGLEILEIDVHGRLVRACVGGIGKVRAAHAAAVLLAAGPARALLVVGTCGGLSRGLVPGTLVHATSAIQTDLGVRDGRENSSDPDLRAAWIRAASGVEARFLTADRPVFSPWRRLRLARAFPGPCAAEMETAAAAAVAERAGVPWASARTVTDRASLFALRELRTHFETCAGLAADTVANLVASEGFLALASRNTPR